MGRDRVRAAAVVVAAASGRRGERLAGGGLVDAVFDWYSKEPWDLDLEVRPAGAAAYRVAVRTRIPNRLGGLRNALKDWRPVPGLEVPVLVDPARPDAVEVDWQGFADAGGLRTATTATSARRVEEASEAAAQAMRSNPKMQAQMRSNFLTVGHEMARGVPAGHRPAEEFARWVWELEQGGAITAEEAADLRSIAGLMPEA